MINENNKMPENSQNSIPDNLNEKWRAYETN